MEEFFLGPKEQTFTFRIGDLTVGCTVSSVWRDIQQGGSCACGAEGRVKVSKEVGVSRRDSVTLKQSWETTLGGAAVLAQIKATMEESLATSISWEERESIETECKFVAPKCGRRTELVYQLQRDYAFNFQKPGLFGLKS